MGFPWAKFAHLAETFAPLILAGTPLGPVAEYISIGISVAERAAATRPMTGADKLALAVKEVQNGVAAVNAQTGRVVMDPAVTEHALAAGISAVVDIIKIKEQLQAVPALAEPARPIA